MSNDIDRGTAYELAQPSSQLALTEVRRGTPMGALLRRYWHPVGMARDATETPRLVRVLSEELILFRDKTGKAGVLYPRCMHRGASLFYGKVDERGIRCCYHGWLYDVEGHCLEQPCEPRGGRFLGQFRQPWYPVQERYGLVFAYLGPPEKKPVLPRYEVLEQLGPGEWVEADDSSIGGGGGVIIPCNWLQHFENVMDPFHVPILHGSFSGTQFVEQLGILPEVSFELSPRGVMSTQLRMLPDGSVLRRVTEAVLPTVRVVASPRVGQYGAVESIGWVLPLDDSHFRIYVAGRVTQPSQLARMKSTFNKKSWSELTAAEHQSHPGDYEAQVSQGPVTFHSEEHLVTSDRGVVMLRKLLKKQLEVLAGGGDPIGVCRSEHDAVVRLDAGNYLQTSDGPE